MKGNRNAILRKTLRLIMRLIDFRFGLSIAEIRRELGCSRRTAYRYLDAVKEAGFEVSVFRVPAENQIKYRLARRDEVKQRLTPWNP